MWGAAVRLDVPICLHHAAPPLASIFEDGGLYAPMAPGSFPNANTAALGTAAWGRHSYAGLSFLRLYAGSVFDRFPELQLYGGNAAVLSVAR